jgi:hypothetical protein
MANRGASALLYAVIGGGLIALSPYALQAVLAPSSSWVFQVWDVPRLPGWLLFAGGKSADGLFDKLTIDVFNWVFYGVVLFPLIGLWLVFWSWLQGESDKGEKN